MTERRPTTEDRITTEDIAARRGSAEHDGVIVPQDDRPQDDRPRDDRPRDDRTEEASNRDVDQRAATGADREHGGREPVDREPHAHEPHDRDTDTNTKTGIGQSDTWQTPARDTGVRQLDTRDTDTRQAGGRDTRDAEARERAERDLPVEQDPPVVTGAPVEPSAVSTTAGSAPLFAPEDAADHQAEWRALQAAFVDDPREAVRRADELVARVMRDLATTFAEHKRSLEGQWQEGGQADTEELRQALKRYRSFFDRLLSV